MASQIESRIEYVISIYNILLLFHTHICRFSKPHVTDNHRVPLRTKPTIFDVGPMATKPLWKKTSSLNEQDFFIQAMYKHSYQFPFNHVIAH